MVPSLDIIYIFLLVVIRILHPHEQLERSLCRDGRGGSHTNRSPKVGPPAVDDAAAGTPGTTPTLPAPIGSGGLARQTSLTIRRAGTYFAPVQTAARLGCVSFEWFGTMSYFLETSKNEGCTQRVLFTVRVCAVGERDPS